ncbi:hypothetical protein GBAR_LOCUS12340 [Geodia barretti]|nr:hypothetical protein GBAR_LOCUS12340 [Geodia barretti]
MAWGGQRARNLGLISDYVSDYFSESSAESEHSNWESEEEGEDSGAPAEQERVGRSKIRAPPRYPRPHSHLLRKRDGQRARGNKHSRRWENSVFISTLHQLPEEEIKKGYSILPEHCSSFTKLHTDQSSMQVWQEFTSFPEEEQGAILGGSWRSPPIQGGKGVSRKGGSVEDRYSIIDRHIRVMLKHNKHLPHEFLRAVEAELTEYFMTDHCTLVVAIHHDT